MERLTSLLAWLAVAVVAALAALNWSTLMVLAPLDLVVAQIQAPLGVVLLGVAGVLVALFFVAYLRNQIGSLLETRRLLKEIQRVQDLADKAESSRLDNLQHLMVTEFRQLNETLNAFAANASANTSKPESPNDGFKPVGLTEIMTGR